MCIFRSCDNFKRFFSSSSSTGKAINKTRSLLPVICLATRRVSVGGLTKMAYSSAVIHRRGEWQQHWRHQIQLNCFPFESVSVFVCVHHHHLQQCDKRLKIFYSHPSLCVCVFVCVSVAIADYLGRVNAQPFSICHFCRFLNSFSLFRLCSVSCPLSMCF